MWGVAAKYRSLARYGATKFTAEMISFQRMHFSARKYAFLWKHVDVTGTSQKTAEICERVSGVKNQER